MVSAVIAAVFGVGQAWLLKKTLFAVTGGNYTSAVVFLIIKFILYGGALAVLMMFFSSYVINCLLGYAAGLPLCVAAWFLYKTLRSGDGKNESNNNN